MNDPTKSKYRYLSFSGAGAYRRYVRESGEHEMKQATAPVKDHELPAHGTYGGLLFHPLWKSRRQEILARDAHRCVVCRHTEGLQVHHRQYHFVVRDNKFKDPWDYADHLLLTLCEACHKKGHSKYKVPIINI